MPLPIIHTLADDTVRSMLARAQDYALRQRQQDAADRLSILKDSWKDVVWHYIVTRYPDRKQITLGELRQALYRRVTLTMNVLRRLTDTVCVAYKRAPLRELEGAPEAVSDAFSKIKKQTRITTLAKDFERHAWALNVIIVVPTVRPDMAGRGKRTDFDVIYPHHAEVTHDGSDPMGDPAAVTYSVKLGSDRTGGDNPLVWVVLDRETWRYYDPNGRPIKTVPHNAGLFPGQVFRLSNPVDDWWDSTRGEGVVDATKNVAHQGARLEWVRDMQDRKREILHSKKEVPPQFMGGVVQLRMDPGEAQYEVHDAEVDPEFHLAMIRWHYHQAAESMRVPSVLADFELSASNYANVTGLAAAQAHEALVEVRSDHIDWLMQAEGSEGDTGLWYKTALVMRGMGHPLAPLLEPDRIADTLKLTFPELALTDHPKSKLEVLEKEVSLGIASTYEAYMRMHPQVRTIDEARERVLEIARQEGELDRFYIEHGIPKDAAIRATSRQELLGRIGGEASGAVRRGEQDDDGSDPGRGADDGDSR